MRAMVTKEGVEVASCEKFLWSCLTCHFIPAPRREERPLFVVLWKTVFSPFLPNWKAFDVPVKICELQTALTLLLT